MNGCQDATEQSATDRNLDKLERDGAGVTDDPRADLDQPRLQAGQGPVGHLFGQIGGLQEDAEIVSQSMEPTHGDPSTPTSDRFNMLKYNTLPVLRG